MLPAREKPSAPGWALLTLYREHAPRRFDLMAQSIGSGLELRRGGTPARQLELAWELEDPHVSTRHARLVAGASGVEIQDLGSKNGVWVDGQRVDRAALRPGALVRIGRTLLSLVGSLEPEHHHPLVQRAGLVWGSSLRSIESAIAAQRVDTQHWLLWGEPGSGRRSVAGALSAGVHARGVVEFDAARIPNQLLEVELLGNQRVRGAVFGAGRGLLYVSRPEQLAERLLPALFEQAALARTTLAFGLTSAAPEALVRAARTAGAAELRLPSLRERVVEIPALVHSVIPRGLMTVSVEFVEACCLQSWPGNVSQLVRSTRDALARAVAARASTLEQQHLCVDGSVR